MTDQQQDPLPTQAAQQGVVNKAGVREIKNEEQRLRDNISNLSSEQLERLKARKANPAQTKRKILADRLRKDPTAMSLMQMASASYAKEIDKYNVQFLASDV